MKAASNLARLLLMLSACVCYQITLARVAAATVTTDQSDYPPGATAYITGSGFAVGETVQCQVLHADGTFDNTTSGAHAPWYVTDGGAGDLDGVADGTIKTTWLVPADEDEVGATLELTATGQTSGLVATTLFT